MLPSVTGGLGVEGLTQRRRMSVSLISTRQSCLRGTLQQLATHPALTSIRSVELRGLGQLVRAADPTLPRLAGGRSVLPGEVVISHGSQTVLKGGDRHLGVLAAGPQDSQHSVAESGIAESRQGIRR